LIGIEKQITKRKIRQQGYNLRILRRVWYFQIESLLRYGFQIQVLRYAPWQDCTTFTLFLAL
jgi:hypothetical protein